MHVIPIITGFYRHVIGLQQYLLFICCNLFSFSIDELENHTKYSSLSLSE
jgi:hypothetical protein